MKTPPSSLFLLFGTLSLFFFTSFTSGSAAEPFPDLKSPILREAVTNLANRGILEGYPDGSFKPDKAVNRAETLKMIFAMREEKTKVARQATESTFSDVSRESWYFPYVYTAEQNEIIQGYEDGSFRPSQSVSRAEFMKMALKGYQYFETSDLESYRLIADKYTDFDLSDWFIPYLSFSIEKRIIDIDSPFDPHEEMSRGEAALFLFHALSSLDRERAQWKAESGGERSCEMCILGVDYSQFPWAHFPFVDIKDSKILFQGVDETWKLLSGDYGVTYFEEKALLWETTERLKLVADDVKLRVDRDFPEYYERARGLHGGFTKNLVHYSGMGTIEDGANLILTKDGVFLLDPACDCAFEKNFLWVYAYHSPIKQNPDGLRFFEWQETDYAKRATYDALFLTVTGRNS